ncbi:hypothetical protein LIER_39895 [Lithospermum erythrorhizon]|uniref:RNase H type-1 domain-containing protein n=1 Tax=Lithospermum erythrorhizon TaxID=34254 RepID=A0AAV3QQ69_LITER
MMVGLKLVKSLNITEVLVNGDSKLLIDRIQGKCEVKSEVLKKYHSKVVSLAQGFARISFRHIPQEENEESDRLSRLATTYYSDLPEGVSVEMCNQPAYEECSVCNIKGVVSVDWRTPIIQYLSKDLLPADKYEAQKIQNRSFEFQIYQEELYRKSWDGPLLLCVSTEDIPKVLAEGWCGSHIRARSLAIKITKGGYYCPILVKDALSYVKKCDACQRLGNAP